MPHNNLFKALCTPEIMKVGWHLAQADSRDDFVLDPIGQADFASNLDERLSHLVEQVEAYRYRPRHLLEIDIPKSGLSVRPGNVLPVEEAALLHAIVYLLAPLFDKKLSPQVYSYRLHPDWKRKVRNRDSIFREADVAIPFLKRRTIRAISPFEAWYEGWPEFEEKALHAYTQEGYTHLTKTDITAYFENIDLHLLDAQLRTLLKREEDRILQLLFRILEGWTRVTSMGTPIGRGIPQGNEISSFLANLYLIPLDRALEAFCRQHSGTWFRYVDDVKVFTRSERDARAAVFVINDALRSLHLNLQGSKTEVLSGDTLKRELDHSKIDDVDKVYTAIRKLGREDRRSIRKELAPLRKTVARFCRGLPASVKTLSGKENRLFRRLLTAYGHCSEPRLREAAFSALGQLPDLRILKKTLQYLGQQDYRLHDDTEDRLLAMLENEELPFPYQAGLVLEAIGYLHPSQPFKTASRIRQYALEKKRHWLVVQKALEAIACYPYRNEHALTLAERFIRHEHPMVRRAACVLLVRSPKDKVRKTLRKLIYHADDLLNRLSLFLLRLVQDKLLATAEIGRIKAGSHGDFALLKSLPRLYALTATEDREVAKLMDDCISVMATSESAKIKWHHARLKALAEWSKR